MAASASEKIFGFPTRLVEAPEGSELGLAATQIFLNNPDRVFWLVVNLGPGTVYIAYKRQVDATHGIRLGPLGGFASSKVDEDGEAVAYELFGIATVANNDIYFLEVEKSRNLEAK